MSTLRPVSGVSDGRFSNKDAKLLKTLKFPKEYDLKVDLNKVNWEVIKGWVAKRITELLGMEDEVLIGYVFEQLENKAELNPKRLQINLTGFLEKNTSLFVKELWVYLHSANSSQSYIPQQILDQKAEELRKRKEISDQINESLAKEREKRKQEELEAADKEAKERERRRREREDHERKERQAIREREDRERQERRKRIDEEREKERALRRDRDRDRDRERNRDRDRDQDRDRRHRNTARADSPTVKRARYARSRSRERRRSPSEPVPEHKGHKAGEDAATRVSKHDEATETVKQANGAEEDLEAVKHKDKKHKKHKKEKKKEKKEKKEKKHKKDMDLADDKAERKSLEEQLREQALALQPSAKP